MFNSVMLADRKLEALQQRGLFDTLGAVWIVDGRFYLYLERRYEMLAIRMWAVNPLTLLAYPFWRAWRLIEYRLIFAFIRFLFVHDLMVWVWHEGERLRYRDVPRALWFTKTAKDINTELSLTWQAAKERDDLRVKADSTKAFLWDKLMADLNAGKDAEAAITHVQKLGELLNA